MKQIIDYTFYLVTCPSISKKGNLFDVKNAVDAGCKIVQYREKNKTTNEMIKEAKKIKEICKKKALLIIDDRIDVALAVGADGVHIGQDDISIETARMLLGKEKIIGLTVHNLKESIDAEKKGVDYIGLAPIFATETKQDSGAPCGPDLITEIRKKVNLPIIAVGGIKKENVNEVISKGADGVVAVSAVLDSNDIFSEVSKFIKIIKEVKGK